MPRRGYRTQLGVSIPGNRPRRLALKGRQTEHGENTRLPAFIM